MTTVRPAAPSRTARTFPLLAVTVVAACAVLTALFAVPHIDFAGVTGIVATALLVVAALCVALLARKELARTELARQEAARTAGQGRLVLRSGPLFTAAGLLFVLLAIVAPASVLIAGNVVTAPQEFQWDDPRSVLMTTIAMPALLVGLVAAVRGLVVWTIGRVRAGAAVHEDPARTRFEAAFGVVVQVLALTTVLGTVFILY